MAVLPRSWVLSAPACERCDAITLATTPISGFMDGGVDCVIWMTAGAFRTKRRGEDSAFHVDLVSDRLKMIRPNASSVTAEVIPFEAEGWFSCKEVMGRGHASSQREHAIAFVIDVAAPHDAAICTAGIDLRPKTLFSGKLAGHGSGTSCVWERGVRSAAAPSILLGGAY